jgi:DNA-binding response OmpR family regulator
VIDDVEYWRTRCEIAERTLKGNEWHRAAKGFTLTETRILKLLWRRPMTGDEVADFLSIENERLSDASVKTHVHRCRTKLGVDVVPLALVGDRRYSLQRTPHVRRLLRVDK